MVGDIDTRGPHSCPRPPLYLGLVVMLKAFKVDDSKVVQLFAHALPLRVARRVEELLRQRQLRAQNIPGRLAVQPELAQDLCAVEGGILLTELRYVGRGCLAQREGQDDARHARRDTATPPTAQTRTIKRSLTQVVVSNMVSRSRAPC